MLFFFRDPKRKLPPNGKIVSPVDGKIVEIEEFPDGKKRIAIFLSLLNVHTVRTPMDAVVIKNQFFPGRFFRADRVEAGRDNQYVLLELDTEYGITTLRVISGAVARRVIVYPQKDDALKSGERIGFVRFGSRCEITFPEGFELFVKKGDRLKASVSELGSFNS